METPGSSFIETLHCIFYVKALKTILDCIKQSSGYKSLVGATRAFVTSHVSKGL